MQRLVAHSPAFTASCPSGHTARRLHKRALRSTCLHQHWHLASSILYRSAAILMPSLVWPTTPSLPALPGTPTACAPHAPAPAGSLSVDAIPFNATRPEHVKPVYQFASASVPAFGGRLAWNGSLEGVLAAAGNGSARGGAGGSGTAASTAADPADFFLRLRYCPVTIHPSQDSNGTAVPNPFFDSGSSSGSGSSGVLQQGGSGSAAERRSVAGDGSEGGARCDAPVQLPGSISSVQCAAAKRLLQCSESLVFLTELKDARLAPADVTAEVAPAGSTAQQAAASDAPGGSFAVRLSSDAVALFVSVEAEQQAGRFNGSARLLLPWQPQTLVFFPAAQALSGSPGSASTAPQEEPGGPGMGAASAGPAAEQAQVAGQGAAADPPGAAPSISVYWLQQALAELQPEAQAQAASSAGASSAGAVAGPLPTLLLLALLCVALV